MVPRFPPPHKTGQSGLSRKDHFFWKKNFMALNGLNFVCRCAVKPLSIHSFLATKWQKKFKIPNSLASLCSGTLPTMQQGSYCGALSLISLGFTVTAENPLCEPEDPGSSSARTVHIHSTFPSGGSRFRGLVRYTWPVFASTRKYPLSGPTSE